MAIVRRLSTEPKFSSDVPETQLQLGEPAGGTAGLERAWPHRRLGAGKVLWRLTAVLTLFCASPVQAGDPEYGAYLAQECSSCHQKNGEKVEIPKIGGLPVDYFIQALLWYKDGTRENVTMQAVARSLDDEQIAALAAYFAGK